MTSNSCSLSYFEHSSNWYFSIHSLWRCIIMVFQQKTTIRSHHQEKTSIQVWRQNHILSYFEHSSSWYFSIHSLWRYIIIVFQEKTTIRSHYQEKTSIQVWHQIHVLYHILNIARTGTFQYIHSEGISWTFIMVTAWWLKSTVKTRI